MRKVSGFTLIELIAVIAILAILAVTALPRFIDLRSDAAAAAVQGVGGAIASAAAINFAKRVTTTTGGGTSYLTITACSQGNLLLTGQTLPAGYTLTPATAIANGAVGSCILTAVVSGVTAAATFVIIGAS